MAKRRRDYSWYVEAYGGDIAHTNATIARALREETDDSHSLLSTECADGKTHMLWSCPEKKARELWGSRNSLHISIRVWRSENCGKIWDITSLFAKIRGQRNAKAAT